MSANEKKIITFTILTTGKYTDREIENLVDELTALVVEIDEDADGNSSDISVKTQEEIDADKMSEFSDFLDNCGMSITLAVTDGKRKFEADFEFDKLEVED